jgi:esterase
MPPILNHTAVKGREAPEHWLYMLHGIFGSGRNWASPARRLVEAHPSWGVVLVDLRLHGESTGFAPPHTIKACAEDVVRLENEIGAPPAALMGHSFGGKVALVRSATAPTELRQVWVLDSPLSTGDPTGSAWEVLQVVRSLPDRYASRDQLVDALRERGYGPALGQWMAMNLERHNDGFVWRLDWEGVEEMLRDYHATDVWKILEEPNGEVDLHVVRATGSTAIDEATLARLEAASRSSEHVHLHEIGGGHWVNVENPRGVQELLDQHLFD